MNTELRNKAWQVLPKEFKEEVKYEYHRAVTKATKDEYDLGFMHAHEGMFGIHNLTSDAEEEELLTCEKYKVEEALNYCDELDSISGSHNMLNWGKQMIVYLFGSKCLLDDTKDDTKEPKPAEPKFAKGDMIHCKSFGYEGDYKVLEYSGGPRNCYDCIDKYGAYYRFYESDLEPVEIIIKRKKK